MKTIKLIIFFMCRESSFFSFNPAWAASREVEPRLSRKAKCRWRWESWWNTASGPLEPVQSQTEPLQLCVLGLSWAPLRSLSSNLSSCRGRRPSLSSHNRILWRKWLLGDLCSPSRLIFMEIPAWWEPSHYLLILPPCPMRAGGPLSMSFRTHFSKANAATLKKKLCTFSPGKEVSRCVHVVHTDTSTYNMDSVELLCFLYLF